MIPISQFHRDYLVDQGVIILPKSRITSRVIGESIEVEVVKVNMYERE
jgi:hypothetical protein